MQVIPEKCTLACLGSVKVEVPPGELLDKITILQIKSERILQISKLQNVRLELAALSQCRDQVLPDHPRLAELATELKIVNERLWDVEDCIRDCERRQEFGAEFIAFARSVYRENDRRAEIKREINVLLGSRLVEEKSYTAY
jgi:hypothetical protein